jgi:hypothetical protein
MEQEHNEELCRLFPEMLTNRHKPDEPCVTWGFECGDGWFNLLKVLMANIQNHLHWKEKNRQYDIRFDAIAVSVRRGEMTLFNEEFGTHSKEFQEEKLRKLKAKREWVAPDPIPPVVLEQVKEKFGTLRFYYKGGDEYIRGLVALAEDMSAHICEDCGDTGTTRGGGWVRTLCDKHEAEYQERRSTK